MDRDGINEISPVRARDGNAEQGRDIEESALSVRIGYGAPEPIKRHHGVCLSGAEFGETVLPGKLGTNYIFPTTEELDYYKQKGVDLIRIPFLWERMQPGLLNKKAANAEVERSFDPGYSAQMEKFLSAADQRGMKVVLDAQQFGRYQNKIIGASEITNDDFKQFWGQMAKTFGRHESVYGWDLSNEPHDEDNKTWYAAAQAGLDGVRAAGDKHAVVVEGNHWSGTADWDKYNSDIWMQDPANNTVYSAHSYWDVNHSGRYDGGARTSYNVAVLEARLKGVLGLTEDSANLGVNDARPFVEWLKRHHARGYFGEYGVPSDDPAWAKMQDRFLSYAKANNMDTTAWGGGPWWGKGYDIGLEKGPVGEQSVNGPESLGLKSVFQDGNFVH